MAKIKYRDIRLQRKTLRKLDEVIPIVEEYQAQGISLTLRQLYYQLVARDLIPNRLNEYDNLGKLVTKARYCGLIDWEAIEDRIRVPSIPSEFENITNLVEVAANIYRLDRWEGQEYYVELFTEKDALSSVLAPIADKWHVPFCVGRGFSSATALFDTGKRMLNALELGKSPVVLYLGDHDPSGLDMTRDLGKRVKEFCHGRDITIKYIAITREQIQQYNPPPAPVKGKDTRAEKYVHEHGQHTWEVDALPPDVLNEIVDKAIGELIDVEQMDAVIEKEESDKRKLRTWAQGLNGKNEA